jgi:hypothetical protein
MDEISKQEKIEILRMRIRELDQMLYNHSISKRVADKCSDVPMSERAMKAMEELEKQKDVILDILKEVELE